MRFFLYCPHGDHDDVSVGEKLGRMSHSVVNFFRPEKKLSLQISLWPGECFLIDVSKQGEKTKIEHSDRISD
jgi:hypothetical protein